MTGLRRRVARGAAGPCAALLLLLSFGGPLARAEEGKSPGGEQPAPIQEELRITNQDTGETRTAVQLGGELGIQAVKGVKTRLYVLQAASPERFRTEGAPTHLFNVALSDEKKGGNITNASVTLTVKGPGKDTPAIVESLDARGVERVALTLHIGYGTFKPVRTEVVDEHVVDPERYEIPRATAAAINRALDERRRVVAVGTTTTRALETAALQGGGRLAAGAGVSGLFIRPGFAFGVVGALVTNFHLPRSSLPMLVCAFAGRERVLAAYAEAVAHRFRFYSYGDAMLIA